MERMADPTVWRPEECSGVLVLAELRHGAPAGVTLEVLGEGRRLADALGGPLHAAVLGSQTGAAAEELRHYGVDKVHVVEDPALAHFLNEIYCAALASLARQIKPSVVLAGATTLARSVLPAVAAELGGSFVAGCTAFAVERKDLLQTRPDFGGATFACVRAAHHRPQIATVRRRTMKPAERREIPAGEVIAHGLSSLRVAPENAPGGAAVGRARFLESVKELAGAVDVTEADVIVAGGRGLGGPEGFPVLQELAKALGGVVGASRAAVDAGWISYAHQIGQTGKTVKPKLYVACGISGAIQHLVGMRASDTIVAVNRDPEAPIFKTATFGIVGDWRQIVPALTRRFSQPA